MNNDTILTIAAVACIVFLIGAIVLVYVGFKPTIKALKSDTTALIPKETIIRSTLFLVGAILLVSMAYTAAYFKYYVEKTSTLTELFLANFLYVLKAFGWIAAIPWLLGLFRKTSRPRMNDTDKM